MALLCKYQQEYGPQKNTWSKDIHLGKLKDVIRIFHNEMKDKHYPYCPAHPQGLNWTPWPESESELYRQSDRRLSAKLVPNFADRVWNVVSVTDPYGSILGFLDRKPQRLVAISGNGCFTKCDTQNSFYVKDMITPGRFTWNTIITSKGGHISISQNVSLKLNVTYKKQATKYFAT
jgi:hypothetical protein